MGTIISFNPEKGFGFLKAEDSRNLFFHISDCVSVKEDIKVGKKVTFIPKEYIHKGCVFTKAVNVRIM